MSLEVRWVTIRAAKRFVREHHRHRPKLTGAIVALGCFAGGRLVGVAVLGRPVARLDNPLARVEITRLCTDGHRNACSKLYSKAKRLAQALGFVGLKTFTLLAEPGSSLRAVGAEPNGLTGGGAWSREGRRRSDADTDPKRRWSL